LPGKYGECRLAVLRMLTEDVVKSSAMEEQELDPSAVVQVST